MKKQPQQNSNKVNNTNTIVFYGRDNSPLEEAYIGYPDNGEMRCIGPIKDLQSSSIFLEILKRYLIDLNQDICSEKKDSVQIIGHSEKKVGNENSYTLYSPEYLKLTKPEELNDDRADYSKQSLEVEESEEFHDDTASSEHDNSNKISDKKEKFSNLVGTVRKTYKTDVSGKSYLMKFLNDNNVKKHKDKADWKMFEPLINRQGRRETGELIIKLVISSRFDTFNQEEPEKSQHFFLADLLLCNRLNLKFDSRHHVDFNSDSIFDFYLLWIILDNFKLATSKGFFKKYQRFEKNDRKLRGSINFARHIKLNMGMDNGCIAYSYRENSLDNEVNHLILAAVDYLREKYPVIVDNNIDNELYAEMNHLKYEIGYPKYSNRELINLNSTPISHPFFSEYRDLQQNCLKVLRDEGVSPFGNEDEHVSGILYYVPDLWEDYLLNLMKKTVKSIAEATDIDKEYQIKVCDQKPIDVFADIDGKGGHSTYPDYIFEMCSTDDGQEESKPFFILDAKYKTGWSTTLKGEFISYLFEDYNKCIRDMGSIQSVSTGVLFPMGENELKEYEETGIQIFHRFSKYNELSCFYTIPVVVPAVQDKQSFWMWQLTMKDKLENNEELLNEIVVHELKQFTEIQNKLKNIKKNNKAKMKELNEKWKS